MEGNKISNVLNLCNQGNTLKAKKSNLLQSNILVMIGLDHLNRNIEEKTRVPIKIYVKKAGELEIDGLDEVIMNDSNIRIYSDKKVTKSEEKGDL